MGIPPTPGIKIYVIQRIRPWKVWGMEMEVKVLRGVL